MNTETQVKINIQTRIRYIKKMNSIEKFSRQFLDEKELKLAEYLCEILGNKDCIYSSPLMLKILPIYSEKRDGIPCTLDPDPIYRPFYYLHMYSSSGHFKEDTRVFLTNASNHLEGCLLWLTENPPKFRGKSKQPFGGLVHSLLRKHIISNELASNLLEFNKLFNIPTKHRTAFFKPHSRLDERTFSIFDACLGFMVMRKLSIELFKILILKNVNLPHTWKKFDDAWFSPYWSSTLDR